MKILIADDHILFRSGMRHLLQDLGEEVDIFEAGNLGSVRKLISEHEDLDIALLDLEMPGMNGWDGVSETAKASPAIPIVIISSAETRDHVMKAIECGVAGYIPKTSEPKVMLAALRLVLSGGMYLPPILIEGDPPKPAGQDSPPSDGFSQLTPRQKDVLDYIVQGKSNKEIARLLALAEGTVKVHVAGLVTALGVHNRTEAVAEAFRLGLVPDRQAKI